MTHHWLVSGVGRSGTTALYTFLAALSQRLGGGFDFYYEPYLWGPPIWRADLSGDVNEFSSTSSLYAEGLFTHLSTPLFQKSPAPEVHNRFVDSLFADSGKNVLAKIIRGSGRLECYLDRLPELKVVHVIRNPMDCINSQLGNFSFFGEEFHPSDATRLANELNLSPDSWDSECAASADWWKHMNDAALAAAQRYPDRVFILPYEAIKLDPEQVSIGLLEHLGVDISPEIAPTFEQPVGVITRTLNLRTDDVSRLTAEARSYFEKIPLVSGMKVDFDRDMQFETVLNKYAKVGKGVFAPAIRRDFIGLRLRRLLLHERQVAGKQIENLNQRVELIQRRFDEKAQEFNDARRTLEVVSAEKAAAERQVSRLQSSLEKSEFMRARSDDKAQELAETRKRLTHRISQQQQRIAEFETVLEPRLRTLLTLRPLRHILAERRRLIAQAKAVTEENEPVGANSRAGHSSSDSDVDASAAPQAALRKTQHASIYDDYEITKPLGIAVFAHDRRDVLSNTLESLNLQGVIGDVVVFIDGDQGRPSLRSKIDATEAVANAYNVRKVVRNRGNFGFRKMMLLGMREMMSLYDRMLFLEDDCFPTHAAVKGFSQELDAAENDPNTFSVYGHPFLVPRENSNFPRFQGWGWATTADKLRPIWEKLLECYLMSESEYLGFVREKLTPELRNQIDVTPGRQPTDTLLKFFAWDETVCLLTALEGLTHRSTAERIIYNCGAGEASTHFVASNQYRRAPFNMISVDEVWSYF